MEGSQTVSYVSLYILLFHDNVILVLLISEDMLLFFRRDMASHRIATGPVVVLVPNNIY
jgi:hypothetical protein